MPEFWDFNENVNYATINVNGKNYKVLNAIDKLEAAILMYKIDNFIRSKMLNLSKVINKYPTNIKNGLEILLNTEYSCQEMQIDTSEWPVPFEGLNKPKCLNYSPYYPSVGKDKKLRACTHDRIKNVRMIK